MKKYWTIIAAAAVLAACSGTGTDVTEGSTNPSAPTGLKVHDASQTYLTFQWDAMSGATGYEWNLKLSGTTVDSGTTKSRNTSVSNLSAGTTYIFSVASTGADGYKSSESSIEATTDKEDDGGGSSTTFTPPVESVSYSDFKMPAIEEDGLARAFPGAEGGGMWVTGGRGGTVYHVTNLNDSGTGSLRAALTASGTRTVVFDVAGIIELQSSIKISNGDLTVAGQTAPGGGICIKNYTINVNADNVIIRFLHFRLGDEGPNAGDGEDCIWGRYHNNIVIDHCSMSWSIDECASFYANENFTMQWCILTESMNNSAHSKGAHGYGGIWGGKNASFHHNLLANHHSRNPRPDHPEIYPKNDGIFDLSKRGNVDFRNLVIYNWGDNHTYGGEGGHFNLVNCYYKPGPDSKDRYYFFDAYSVYSSSQVNYGYPALYLTGNVHTAHSDITSNNTTHGVYFHDASSYNLPSDYAFQTSAWALTGPSGEEIYTTTHTADQAFDAVLDYAGDRLHRDSVDERAVDGVKNNTGKIIDTPVDVGGWPAYEATEYDLFLVTDTDRDGIPDWFEDAADLDKNNASDGAQKSIDTAGRYTNLEMYLHYLVRETVAAQTEGGTYTKL